MTMKEFLVYLVTIGGIILIGALAEGHPGRLDEFGGHYDKRTGEYHLHRTGLPTLEIRRDTIYKAHIERVIDGDTAVVSFIMEDGTQYEKERVRFLGLDTPEKGVDRIFDVGGEEYTQTEKAFMLYGNEASDFTTRALTGRIVWLQTETEVKDMYGRMLAYVWTSDPTAEDLEDENTIRAKMFNAKLLLEGQARLLTIPPNGRYTELFTKFLEEAKYALRGFWGS